MVVQQLRNRPLKVNLNTASPWLARLHAEGTDGTIHRLLKTYMLPPAKSVTSQRVAGLAAAHLLSTQHATAPNSTRVAVAILGIASAADPSCTKPLLTPCPLAPLLCSPARCVFSHTVKLSFNTINKALSLLLSSLTL